MAATLGDIITWLTLIIGTPAVLIWILRGINVSKLWRRARIAWLRAYVAWDDWRGVQSEIARDWQSPAVERPSEIDGLPPLEVPSERVPLTRLELARYLAMVDIVDDDGARAPMTKAHIAKAVGKRLEVVSAVIDDQRGVEPTPTPPLSGPRFEQVGPSSYKRVEGT